MRSFNDLPQIPGDPFFALEPRARKYVAQDVGDACPVSLDELLDLMAPPHEISELQIFAPLIRHKRGRVGHAADISEFGVCYSATNYPDLEDRDVHWFFALRPSGEPGDPSLVDLFAHELTHVYVGEGHGFAFMIGLCAIRHAAGLDPSSDQYDIHDGFDEVDNELDPDELATTGPEWCASVGKMLAGTTDFPESLTGSIEAIRSHLLVEAPTIRNRADLFNLTPTLERLLLGIGNAGRSIGTMGT